MGFVLAVGTLLASAAAQPQAAPSEPSDYWRVQAPEDMEPIEIPPLPEVQEQLSSEVIALGRRLDAFFGTGDYRTDAEGSLLRVGTTMLIEEDGLSFDFAMRMRLALPRTERRLNLFLDSQRVDPFETPAQRRRLERTDADSSSFVAGLQYLRQLAERWDLDADAGVRVRVPLDPYVRVRVRRSELVLPWEYRVGQSLFWYAQRGRGTSTELLAQRTLADGRLLRSVSDVTWLDREQQFYYSQDLLFAQHFRRSAGVVYQIGIRGESEPNHQLDHYFINLRARRSVGWEWLFVELRPELYFERENNFSLERRFFVTMEVMLGDLRALD
jgi:hypothetical protein